MSDVTPVRPVSSRFLCLQPVHYIHTQPRRFELAPSQGLVGWMHRTVRSPISVCWACQSTLSVQFEQSGPGAMYSSGHLNIPAVAKWHQTQPSQESWMPDSQTAQWSECFNLKRQTNLFSIHCIYIFASLGNKLYFGFSPYALYCMYVSMWLFPLTLVLQFFIYFKNNIPNYRPVWFCTLSVWQL